MSAQVSSGAKVCCSCGKNVSGQKRMKDSQGRYWCVPCGQADQRKKGGGGSSGETTCAGCGGTFPTRRMQEYARQSYCKRCFRKLTGGGFSLSALFSGGGGGSDSDDGGTKKKRIVIMAVAIVVLGLVSAGLNLGWFKGDDGGDEPALPDLVNQANESKK